MTRTNKRTRIKGLTPKLFLQQKDGRSGSIPSISRISSDNRTGHFRIFFDDQSTIPFSGSNRNVVMGASIPTELKDSQYYQEFGQDFTTSLNSDMGSVVKGVADTNVAFTPGQAFEPFKEFLEPAVTSKSKQLIVEAPLDKTNLFTIFPHLSGVKQNRSVEFYATGSDPREFGEDHDEPLWSKTKLQFDLTPSETHSFGIYGDSDSGPTDPFNHPMAYWNKETKAYEGVGDGHNFGSRYDILYNDGANLSGAIKAMLEDQPIGFGKSMDRGGFPSQIGYDATGYHPSQFARPTTAFGFPYHQKFHATSPYIIPMCDYIDRPFLLEKAVLQVSCGCELNQTLGYRAPEMFEPGPAASFLSIATFFILNQRGPVNRVVKQKIHLIEDNFDTLEEPRDLNFTLSFSIPTGSNNIRTDTRDLITYMQIAVLNSAYGEYEDGATDILNSEVQYSYIREAMVGRDDFAFLDFNSTAGSASWRGNFTVEAPVRSLYETDNYSTLHAIASTFATTNASGSLTSGSRGFLRLSNAAFGRNGYEVSNGRNFINVYGDPQISCSVPDRLVSDINISPPISHSKDNPYLLLPTDNLVFGWQVPLDMGLNSTVLADQQAKPIYKGDGPALHFPVFPSKLTLFGSMLIEGKEKNDTLNQLLTSNSVHEAIESMDPSATNTCLSTEGNTEEPEPPEPA